MKPKNVNYYDSSALEASAIIKAASGALYSITGYNDNAGDQFIQIHDSATLPADTAVPAVSFVAPAKENFTFNFEEIGRQFENGIVVCNSSTVATKTIGVADCWFNAQYD